MKCNQFEKLEMKYLDGSLTEAENTALVSHIEECAQCRADFELYKAMLEDLKNLPLPMPEADFTAGVMKEIALVKKPGKGLVFALWCSVLGAISSCAGFLNLVILNEAQLVDALSENGRCMPIARLISLLSSVNDVINEMLLAVLNTCEVYRDSLTFGAFALAIIALGFYTALSKSVVGGIKR